jgi:hypothetical protein
VGTHRPACLYIIEDFSIPFGEGKKKGILEGYFYFFVWCSLV